MRDIGISCRSLKPWTPPLNPRLCQVLRRILASGVREESPVIALPFGRNPCLSYRLSSWVDTLYTFWAHYKTESVHLFAAYELSN